MCLFVCLSVFSECVVIAKTNPQTQTSEYALGICNGDPSHALETSAAAVTADVFKQMLN